MATKKRGRPPKAELTRSAVISIRFTPEQHGAIERAARAEFMDPSVWLRTFVLKRMSESGLLDQAPKS